MQIEMMVEMLTGIVEILVPLGKPMNILMERWENAGKINGNTVFLGNQCKMLMEMLVKCGMVAFHKMLVQMLKCISAFNATMPRHFSIPAFEMPKY